MSTDCVRVGTLGHVEHGKTALTAAIATVLSEYGGGYVRTYDVVDDAAS